MVDECDEFDDGKPAGWVHAGAVTPGERCTPDDAAGEGDGRGVNERGAYLDNTGCGAGVRA